MAFSKKTWTDRVSEQPQRRLLTPTDGGSAMTVDVTRQEGMVIQEGDAFSAANMNDLENRIKTNFDRDEATINTVNNRSATNANNISTLQGNVNTLSTNLTNITNRVTNVENRAGILENELTANNHRIYMDYKNGRYGYNTSANRGADTFHPFNSSLYTVLADVTENNKTYTFTYPYSCAVVMIGGKWVDIATCVGNNCDVYGGWMHSWGPETAGGRMWFINNIEVGSQITWSVNGESAGGTIIGIG